MYVELVPDEMFRDEMMGDTIIIMVREVECVTVRFQVFKCI